MTVEGAVTTVRDVLERHGRFADRGDLASACEAWELLGLPAAGGADRPAAG